jgi:hypothetical protein
MAIKHRIPGGSRSLDDIAAIDGFASRRQFSWFGLYTLTRSNGKRLHSDWMCALACQPLPNSPRTLGFAGARYFAPTALIAATRIFWITPSGMIATGSSFSRSNRITSPHQRFPVATGNMRRRFTPFV